MVKTWVTGTPLRLQTRRFDLRSLGSDDATDTYVSWWNDEEIQFGLGAQPRKWNAHDAQRHIDSFDNKTRFHIGIFPKGEELPIGFIAVFLEPGKLARTNIVVGNKEYWGKRVPIEVRARILDLLFGPFGIERVYGRIHGRNLASIFNYKALGYSAEGVQRQHVIGPGGKRMDILLFGILKEEWLRKREALEL